MQRVLVQFVNHVIHFHLQTRKCLFFGLFARRSQPSGASRMPCMLDHKPHQLFALEKSLPHVVALPRRNEQLHTAACCFHIGAERLGVRLKRHHRIDVAVDRKERDPLRGLHE